MSIISSASGSSCWRGLDYYKNNKIKNIKKLNAEEYISVASGTKEYSVQEKEYKKAVKFINRMSKKELIDELIHIFYKSESSDKYDFWENHIKFVYSESIKLANLYNADLNVVKLGALLQILH